MTRFILIFTLLVNTSHAGSWIAKSDLGVEGAKVFWKKGRCLAQGKGPCIDQTGKDYNTHSLQQVREGDYEAAVSIEPCADDGGESHICEVEFAAKSCPDGTYESFWGDLDTDQTFETWCARRALIEAYREDPTKKSDYDNQIQQLKDQEAALFQAGKDCLQLHRGAGPSNAEVVACQGTILELLRFQFQN